MASEAVALDSAMTTRLTLAACLAGGLMFTALAQPSALALPDSAELATLAALAVDDAPPAVGETFDLAAAEAAALRQADLLPAEQWELEGVASSLGSEPLAAVEFVRDSIATDPYQGVLRGAAGTLAAPRAARGTGRYCCERCSMQAVTPRGWLTRSWSKAPAMRQGASPILPWRRRCRLRRQPRRSSTWRASATALAATTRWFVRP